MALFTSTVILAISQLSFSAPTQDSVQLAKRQEYGTQVGLCITPDCGNCPLVGATQEEGEACIYYDTEQFRDLGYEVQDDGRMNMYFDIPSVDTGCQILIRTPVVAQSSLCGGPVIVGQGSTCAPYPVDSTFIIQSCCGLEACEAVGAPPALMASNAAVGGGSSGIVILKDSDGNDIRPKTAEEHEADRKMRARSAGPSLEKRCESFEATSDPYPEEGQTQIISNIVTCPPSGTCSVEVNGEVTETFSVEGSVEVSDPLGIVSASVSVGWEESISRGWSEVQEFTAGERGYMAFTPILTCVDGRFCDSEETTACGPTLVGGEMAGDIRGVVIRGS